MSRILLVVMLAVGPTAFTSQPAAACHPGPPYLGCPHGCPPVCCPPYPEHVCLGDDS